MILFSSAGGFLGRLVAQRLVRFNHPVAVLSAAPDRMRETARQHGQDLEVRDAQGYNPRHLRRVLGDVTVLLLVGRGHRNESEHEAAILEAARAVRVPHVVRVSMAGAATDAPSAILRRHGHLDDALRRSGLRHTILLPHLFTQDLLEFAADVREGLDILDPTDGAHVPFVDVRDVADSVVSILTQVVHRGTEHTVSGPRAWSLGSVADLLSYNVGHRVRLRPVGAEAFAKHLLERGHDIDDATEIAVLLAAQEDAQPTDTVSRLTGMPPRPLESFLLDHRAHFAGEDVAGPGLIDADGVAQLTHAVTWQG